MKLLVTGGMGFIGSHLIPKLLRAGHQLTVITRSPDANKTTSWAEQVRWIQADIYHLEDSWLSLIGDQDALIHLAWHGLPNYQAAFHLEDNLPAEKRFLMNMVGLGIKQLLITGTCFEYGFTSGCVDESMKTKLDQTNAYALAKDQLRRYLQEQQSQHEFTLQWVRLFYMYGEGQNPKSLLMQLQAAIDEQLPVFNMSGGEQERDYLHVDKVADYLLSIVECRDCDGIVNVCSGSPVTIRSVVENYIQSVGAKIKLNLGYYPYSDKEPMSFWGSTNKLTSWLSNNN